MNLIIDPLPRAIRAGRAEIGVNPDYRVWAQFELLMLDPEFSDQEKLETACALCLTQPAQVTEALAEGLLWFYRCGRPAVGTAARQGGGARVYSLEEDAALIYAAFLQQYRVDLTQRALHWWQFKALFDALTPDTLFCRVMGWRAEREDPKASPEERKRLKERKRLYALPARPLPGKQAAGAIEQALLGGGDVDRLLKT